MDRYLSQAAKEDAPAGLFLAAAFADSGSAADQHLLDKQQQNNDEEQVTCATCKSKVPKSDTLPTGGKRQKTQQYKCKACNRKAVALSRATGRGSSLHEAWSRLTTNDQEEFKAMFSDCSGAAMKDQLSLFIEKKNAASHGTASSPMPITTR